MRKALPILAFLLLLLCALGEEPDRAVCYPSEVTLESWETCEVETVVFPQDAEQQITYASGDVSIAEVDKEGKVTAFGSGSTRITVLSPAGKELGGVNVTVFCGKAAESLSFESEQVEMIVGESQRLLPGTEPADANPACTFETSDETVLAVDRFGTVTALAAGTAKVRAVCIANPGASAVLTVEVSDPARVEEIHSPLENGKTLNVGESAEIGLYFLPDTAIGDTEITNSRPDIVSLENGTVTGLKRGFSVITVQDKNNEEAVLTFRITVTDGSCALTMPLRRTDESGIAENLASIEALKQSALDVIDADEKRGSITSHEAKDRRTIMERAFSMYALPWTVENTVEYWNEEYSEDGAKDFQPGTIYYGLPYISGYNRMRLYNTQRAIEEGYYQKSADGDYYILDKRDEWGYAGNDCSAFVALCLWGYASYEGETIKTYTLFSDTRLQIINDTSVLRPGDILVWYSTHVVMFLYWADEDHTQAVFLQQGGSEPAINTVNAVVEELSTYTDNYYQARRLADFRFYWRE